MYIEKRRAVLLSRPLWNSILLAVCVLFASGTAVAQETTAAIRGKVFGANGAPVTSADVVVTDMRSGVRRTYTTNSSGVFLATRLLPGGPYRVMVDRTKSVVVDNISLGDIYNLSMNLQTESEMEEVVVVGQTADLVDVAAGPAATFSLAELETAVAYNRDITDMYAVDPRVNLDVDGFSVNCGGKHPRFNSVTLDGVSQNDRFGLNSNGYSTATGMPFPYDGIQQVAVELAPFDVTYGGFSACNINAVTKSGSNEWEGNAFYEWNSDATRGDSLEGVDGDFGGNPFNERIYGATLGGPIIKDKLFFFAGYEQRSEPRFLSAGFAGSGNGEERPWLTQADFDRINNISQNTYGYDPGGQPSDGAQEEKKYMLRLDWNINENHNAAFIWNKYDGFQDRSSDGDPNEFEFSNHFYVKGAESETFTVKLASQWTDSLSTEVSYSKNEMDDSQVTVGPPDFGDHQISIGGRTGTVYLGADDSRQANSLDTESDFFRFSGQYLAGDHVITFGYDREDLEIFNQFVQHSRGGEYDYFDDSVGNPAFCAALSAQGRFDDPACGLSGIDRFELGRPSRIYYGSGGGTNVAADAAAQFSNVMNAIYLQDEIFFDDLDLTIVAGLRYEWFESNDNPNFNPAFSAANGIRNDANIDGVDILMPRLGFTWGATDSLSLRGGIGLYSGGNPNVWISNAWSNDGLTNVQLQLRNFGGDRSILDGTIPLTGPNPGFDIPQELFDAVAATTVDSASDSFLVLIDPDYEQPSELKFALGATWDLPWGGIVADIDYLHTKLRDSAYYVDLSQEVVGTTTAGQPIYDFVNGEENYMLTNSSFNGSSDLFSIVLNKRFDFGLDLRLGYAYTDAEDISPMTSSTGGSNFGNTALLDINNPRPGTSNYVVPNRFTFRAMFSREFFGDLETRISLFGFAAEGQPQSYVMGSSDLEGDGFFGRHLLYVPNGPNDPNVVFDANFNADEFFAFVAEEGFEPGFVDRNNRHARWSTRFDLRIDQELPTFIEGTSGRLYLKMYNLGNFLDNDWGKQYDAQFFSLEVLESSVNANGQYVFEEFNDRDITDLLEQRSLWEMRVGLEFRF